MKNLKLLAILVAGAFMFQSCNNDDEGGSANEADLVGVWTSSEIAVDFIADGESYQDENLESQFEGEEETVEFREDKTYTANEGSDEEENGTWSLSSNGSSITLDPDTEESYEYEVVSASSSQLKVKVEEDITPFAAFFGIEVEEELLVVATITMTK